MSEMYTPTTDEVRSGYADGGGEYRDIAEGWFNRWLAGVKADAWDEGHDAATDEAPDGVWPDAWIDTPNPYRQEAQR